uniref:Uncharacterized protein n=1 Tax=Plectus sambesii TaxID=2011161 RepID=A0A914UPJ3_9BILA
MMNSADGPLRPAGRLNQAAPATRKRIGGFRGGGSGAQRSPNFFAPNVPPFGAPSPPPSKQLGQSVPGCQSAVSPVAVVVGAARLSSPAVASSSLHSRAHCTSPPPAHRRLHVFVTLGKAR